MLSYWQNKSHFIDHEYDLVILGAGVCGLSLAYWAQKYGGKIAILEKGIVGAGASGKNAGFLTGGNLNYFASLLEHYGEDKAIELWRFTTENVALVKHELDLDTNNKVSEYHESGTISLFRTTDNLMRIRHAFELLKKNKFDVEELSAPFDFEKAYKIKTDASYNPVEVLNLLKAKLVNTVIYEHTHCLGLKQQGDFVELQTNKGPIFAKKVIMALNAFTGELLPEIKAKITPVRAQMCYLKTKADALSMANYSIPSERIYMRRYGDGILIGGMRYLDEQNENTAHEELNPKIQNALIERCEKYFGSCQLLHKWCGIMGFTQDEQPIVGRSKYNANVFYIGGYSGHGNGYAFKLSKNLIDEYFAK
jgi:gamma-glutamylputrescine oxidase